MTISTRATTTLIGTAAMGHVEISPQPCPTCGGSSETYDTMGSQRRIEELESQVRALTERAATAANKLADYEDELHRMRASRSAHSTSHSDSSRPSSSSHSSKTLSPTSKSASLNATATAAPPTQSRLSSLTSFLPYRRASAATPTSGATAAPAADPQTPTTMTPPSRMHASPAGSDSSVELQNALSREKSLRKAAESQLSQASTELEELTVQLFSQANEMVAQERKARAKLEERVAVLERRDVEKRARLERLENAMARVERLKALVNV
ncbi:hypothetical protein PDE_07772 [Penicillium oxalicum 114-2]|uniref:GDP/GTP exchange factor Sec2 N-terminal domain-containing protein n=2 Tax=Penicillium oxalicum TaxID=69781 RepID=S8BCY8_PENO1|nr:hypothetical protein PDE_07772 [Penicillium oxalicum 114-2]